MLLPIRPPSAPLRLCEKRDVNHLTVCAAAVVVVVFGIPKLCHIIDYEYMMLGTQLFITETNTPARQIVNY